MADTKTTALTAITSWASGDLLYAVSDPGGTPLSRKITLDNVFKNITTAANAKLIGGTGYSLTGSDATSMVDLAGTWNTTGTPTAIKLNITNTASNAASLLMDLQVGGASKFNVRKDGRVVLGSGGPNAGGFLIHSADSTGLELLAGSWLFTNSSSQIVGSVNRSATAGFSTTHNGAFAFGTSTTNANVFAADVILYRDAAATLALRNGTNAQTFRVYNTWTDASNYERGFLRWTANVFELGTASAGTGTARDLQFVVPSAKTVVLDKTTEDNGFFNFKATADADATSAISTLTTSGAVTHHIQIQINGTTAWIPCSTTDPS